MNNGIELLGRSGTDLERFLRVSYRVYRDDPLWVAPIIADLKAVLGPANPFFHHADLQLWVARQNGEDVGRLAAIIDQNHNQAQRAPAAFFGFFESINDPAISHALFKLAFEWATLRGMRRIVGPMNPSTNDECGLLTGGFSSPPVFMMTYNPAYYAALIEAEGMTKAKDLLAYRFDLPSGPIHRFGKIAASFYRRHPQLRVRIVRRRDLAIDLAKIQEIYNAAWQDNWGFVPMTDAEIGFMAARLKPLLREGLVWLAETAGEPVAFLLAVPDYNEAIRPLRGRLLTPRLLLAAPYLLGWKQPVCARVIALGVKKKFRGQGIESVMFGQALEHGLKLGFRSCEASWILEDNVSVQRLIELFGGVPYKTYRLYEGALPPATA